MPGMSGSARHIDGFRSTRWSLVARATAADRAVAARALGELCELYWTPLYVFLRRSGHADHDALDLVQSFCAELLERGDVDGADRRQGAFRSYLLGALRHFVANVRRGANAQKRGGGLAQWSLEDAESSYAAHAASTRTPEQEYERRWAQALLDRVFAALRTECVAKGAGALLEALEPSLLGDPSADRHAAVAKRLGRTEGAIKVALHRLRARLRDLIRDEVLQTVGDPSEVDAELGRLLAAVSSEESTPRR